MLFKTIQYLLYFLQSFIISLKHIIIFHIIELIFVWHFIFSTLSHIEKPTFSKTIRNGYGTIWFRGAKHFWTIGIACKMSIWRPSNSRFCTNRQRWWWFEIVYDPSVHIGWKTDVILGGKNKTATFSVVGIESGYYTILLVGKWERECRYREARRKTA